MPTEQLQECEVAMLAQIRFTHTHANTFTDQLTVNPVDDAVSLAPVYRCQDISMHTNTHLWPINSYVCTSLNVTSE